MKVYELMAALKDCPAGADVTVQRGAECFAVNLEYVETDGCPEYVALYGDGTEPGKDECKP